MQQQKVETIKSKESVFHSARDEQMRLEIVKIMSLEMSLWDQDIPVAVIHRPTKLKILASLDEIPYYIVRMMEPENKMVSTSMQLEFFSDDVLSQEQPLNAVTKIMNAGCDLIIGTDTLENPVPLVSMADLLTENLKR